MLYICAPSKVLLWTKASKQGSGYFPGLPSNDAEVQSSGEVEIWRAPKRRGEMGTFNKRKQSREASCAQHVSQVLYYLCPSEDGRLVKPSIQLSVPSSFLSYSLSSIPKYFKEIVVNSISYGLLGVPKCWGAWSCYLCGGEGKGQGIAETTLKRVLRNIAVPFVCRVGWADGLCGKVQLHSLETAWKPLAEYCGSTS